MCLSFTKFLMILYSYIQSCLNQSFRDLTVELNLMRLFNLCFDVVVLDVFLFLRIFFYGDVGSRIPIA